MSEETTSSQVQGDKPEAGSSEEQQNTPNPDRITELAKQVEDLARQNRKLESDLSDAVKSRAKFKSQLEETKMETASKSGNVEEVHKQYEGKLSELQEQIQALSNNNRDLILEKQVVSKASQKLTPEGVELMMDAYKSKFEITDEGTVRVKDSADTVDEFIEGFGKKIPGVLRTTQKAGSGVTQAGQSSIKQGEVTKTDLIKNKELLSQKLSEIDYTSLIKR